MLNYDCLLISLLHAICQGFILFFLYSIKSSKFKHNDKMHLHDCILHTLKCILTSPSYIDKSKKAYR